MTKLAILGSGNIAPFHIDAALNAGFDITAIASSNNSITARELGKKYHISEVFSKIDQLIELGDFNALSIFLPPQHQKHLLSKIISLNIPTLVEKPVTLYSKDINKYKRVDHVYVGYNRRFYGGINYLKNAHQKSPGIFRITVCEPHVNKKFILENIETTLRTNTVHIFDLINFIVGNFTLKNFQFSNINYNFFCNIFVKSTYIGSLNIKFGSYLNTSIHFENKHLTTISSPLEKLDKFNKTFITEPDHNNPLRIYAPGWSSEKEPSTVYEDLNFKPGFEKQYLEFMEICNDKGKISNLANLNDAYIALKFAEKISESYKRFL
jgi:predicted dehydrogenase